MSQRTPREIAEGVVGSIVRRCIHDWYPLPELGDSAVETLEAAIAAAIQAERDARPPEGHILTHAGVVRKVMGTLVLTDDGAVIGEGARVFMVSDNWRDGKAVYSVTASVDLGEPDRGERFECPVKAAEFLKSLQAAEAAAKGKAWPLSIKSAR